METTTRDAITQKTKELCQAILDQPGVRTARERIQTFATDETARAQYESLINKGQALQQKQQHSQQLSTEEIASFERDREALLNNPIARGFLDAQEELHHVHETVNRYVAKTLELGRMPTDDDFGSEGCGHDGCGCGHDHDHGHHHH